MSATNRGIKNGARPNNMSARYSVNRKSENCTFDTLNVFLLAVFGIYFMFLFNAIYISNAFDLINTYF